MNAGYGVVSYQVKPNENGLDIFTFRGTVEQNVAVALGLDLDGSVDCSPATLTLYNNSCTTDIHEARVHIAERNDAPVAANGLDILRYESTADIIPMRTDTDHTITGSILARPMVASDIDGDRLTWTIRQAPRHGTLITPNPLVSTSSTFEYVPNINFTGYDYFIYSVDDSLDNPDKTLYDVASVIVAVGSATGQPEAVTSHYWVDEDTTMQGRFGRTIMQASYATTLSYSVTNAPNGTVTLLCGGEVQHPHNCSVNLRRRQRQLPVLQLHAAGKFFRHRVDRVSHCIERRFRARVDRRGERDGATGERSTDARQHGGGGGDE